jgi:hypothetical protein
MAAAFGLACGGVVGTPNRADHDAGSDADLDAGSGPDSPSVVEAPDAACAAADAGFPRPIPLSSGGRCADDQQDPRAWDMSMLDVGSAWYQFTFDATTTCDATPSARIASATTTPAGDFGDFFGDGPPGPLAGHRVRFSGWLRTRGATDGAGLFLRVDTAAMQDVAYGDMRGRPVSGDTEWTWYEVVLDVAAEASDVSYGFYLLGPGEVWLAGARIDVVGTCVPTTASSPAGLQEPLGPN